MQGASSGSRSGRPAVGEVRPGPQRHLRFLKDGDLKDDRLARLSASHTKLVVERGGERTRNQSH